MISLNNSPRTVDVDGSILWVIREYTHDEWMHTFTKLNKYCFLIQEETEYLSYIEPVARRSGAYCSNLSEFIEYYERQGLVVAEDRQSSDKRVYRLTESGRSKVDELVSQVQSEALSACLEEWDEKSNLLLLDDVYSAYPEYSLRR